MAEPRYTCGRCGAWICSACGGQRSTTDARYLNYHCPCGSLDYVLAPTMHTERMWRKHNDGDLPFPYPYGQRPEPENWPEGFGPRTIPPRTYRGVVHPGGVVDQDSWRRGVDDVLAQLGTGVAGDYTLSLLRAGKAEELMDAYSTHGQSCAYVGGIIDHVAAEGASMTAQEFARSLIEERSK